MSKLPAAISILCMLALALLPASWAPGQDEASPAPGQASAGQAPDEGAATPEESRPRLERLPPRVEETDTSKPAFNSCAECHKLLGGADERIVDDFRSSVHAELGFGCQDCHGGDPTTMLYRVAMSPEKGFTGKPDRKRVLDVCSRCHSDPSFMRQYGAIRTDQLSLYKTSVHGQALFERNDTNVAVCSDCHTAHHILRVKDPKSSVFKKNVPQTCGHCHGDAALMGRYGLDYTIPAQYLDSVHGQRLMEQGDLGAPVCNDCHGNHGAVPPGVSSIEHVCGQCHLQTEKYYDQSKHAAAFAALGLGRCVVCHNQHSLPPPTADYLNPQATPGCVNCHPANSKEYKTIAAMQDNIKQIDRMHNQAEALVEETEKTTHLSMVEMTPQVEQLNTKMLNGRVLQHETNLPDMEANTQQAATQFKAIQEFTLKLINRSKFNKGMVAVLAALLFAYGVFILLYKKMVLDRVIPWQYYEGPPVEKLR